jgi:hypothetical protein
MPRHPATADLIDPPRRWHGCTPPVIRHASLELATQAVIAHHLGRRPTGGLELAGARVGLVVSTSTLRPGVATGSPDPLAGLVESILLTWAGWAGRQLLDAPAVVRLPRTLPWEFADGHHQVLAIQQGQGLLRALARHLRIEALAEPDRARGIERRLQRHLVGLIHQHAEAIRRIARRLRRAGSLAATTVTRLAGPPDPQRGGVEALCRTLRRYARRSQPRPLLLWFDDPPTGGLRPLPVPSCLPAPALRRPQP